MHTVAPGGPMKLGRCLMICGFADMYGKCGSIDDSVKIFGETPEKNLVTWTALISALGYHGHAGVALERLKEMELNGLKPDSVMLVSLFSACRHGGMVKEGLELFSKMENIWTSEGRRASDL
ncbi:hypothetical protein V2J09_014109 [Rumex salicifolius]